MERYHGQCHPINTCPTISLSVCQKAREGADPLHPWKEPPVPFPRAAANVFPQAEAAFPDQTQRHGQTSELPFLTQRNAHRAVSPGCSPDSTCHVRDWGFISTSQIQGDGRWEVGRWERQDIGTAGETLASESKVKRTHALQALYSTNGDRERLWN